ncbi:MAG TPA: Crp/Fnr family transcriptional regulator [Candidatus Dormibacteraeota bacterium]
MHPDQVDGVLDHTVFRNLDRDELRPRIQSLNVRRYSAGEIVAEPTLRRSALHLLLAGRLRVFDVTCAGKRIILDYIEPGSMDGMLSVAGLRGHFTEAELASDVVTIPRAALEEMIEAEPKLAVNLLWSMSRRLRHREDHVTRLALHDPDQRIAAQLLALSDMNGDGRREAASPRLSHEAIADLLGLRRETVTLHLARLRRMGALRVEDHRFRLNVGLLEAVRDGEVAVRGGATTDD